MDRRNFLKYSGILASLGLISKQELIERINHKPIYALGSAWKRDTILWSVGGEKIGFGEAIFDRGIWRVQYGMINNFVQANRITIGHTEANFRPVAMCVGDSLHVTGRVS